MTVAQSNIPVHPTPLGAPINGIIHTVPKVWIIPSKKEHAITAFNPPNLLATTPIGPPAKNSGTNPGITIMGLLKYISRNIEKIVPKVQQMNPNVAAFGEKASKAATSTAGTA